MEWFSNSHTLASNLSAVPAQCIKMQSLQWCIIPYTTSSLHKDHRPQRIRDSQRWVSNQIQCITSLHKACIRFQLPLHRIHLKTHSTRCMLSQSSWAKNSRSLFRIIMVIPTLTECFSLPNLNRNHNLLFWLERLIVVQLKLKTKDCQILNSIEIVGKFLHTKSIIRWHSSSKYLFHLRI